MAVGAQGSGGGRRRRTALRPGAGLVRIPPAAGPDGPLRLSQHPHGGCQHLGLPPQRRLFPLPAPAELRMEGTL